MRISSSGVLATKLTYLFSSLSQIPIKYTNETLFLVNVSVASKSKYKLRFFYRRGKVPRLAQDGFVVQVCEGIVVSVLRVGFFQEGF